MNQSIGRPSPIRTPSGVNNFSKPTTAPVGKSAKPDFSQNILKSDEDLKEQLEEVKNINTRRTFRRWKGSFLNKFTSFLEKSGIDKAQASYEKFTTDIHAFDKLAKKVNSFEESYKSGSVGVRARNALNEMMKVMTEVNNDMTKLGPTTAQEEKEMGYNKFMLGAVLVREDFEVYDCMVECKELLTKMKDETLAEVADRQILDQMAYYCTCFQRFCDLMADLSLYEVMLKARQFAGDINSIIFINPTTGQIGELDKKELQNAKLLHFSNEGKKETIREAITDRKDKEGLIQDVKNALRL